MIPRSRLKIVFKSTAGELDEKAKDNKGRIIIQRNKICLSRMKFLANRGKWPLTGFVIARTRACIR